MMSNVRTTGMFLTAMFATSAASLATSDTKPFHVIENFTVPENSFAPRGSYQEPPTHDLWSLAPVLAAADLQPICMANVELSVSSPSKDETENWKDVNAEQGMGLAAQAGFMIEGRGAEITMNYEFEIKALTTEQIKQVMKDECEKMSADEQKTFKSNYMETDDSIDGFWDFLGLHLGGKGGFKNEDSSVTQHGERDNKVNDLLRNMFDKDAVKSKVSGEIQVQTLDDFPVKAFPFLRIVHVNYTDSNGENKTMKVIDDSNTPGSAKAARDDGTTDGLNTKSHKIHVMPM